MKKTIISIFTIWFLIVTFAIASDTKVPINVLETFQNKYPGINPYKWEVNEKVAFAFFKTGSSDKVCRITLDGKITDFGNTILEVEVPDEIINTYMENHSPLDVVGFYKITTNTNEKGILIVADDLSYKLCILYSVDGKQIRSEIFEIPEDNFLIDDNEEESEWKNKDEEW